MIAWWNNLELATQIFYCIAIPSTLILLIQTLLLLLGIGGDGDFDDVTPDPIPDDLASGDGIFGEDAERIRREASRLSSQSNKNSAKNGSKSGKKDTKVKKR